MTGNSVNIALLPEVSAWACRLSPASLEEAVERGAAYLLSPAEYVLDKGARDYLESYFEYSAFAARVCELQKEQRELETQEQALALQAETLAAGRARGWGVREHHGSSAGGELAEAGSPASPAPASPPPANPAPASPAPHLVPTDVQLDDEGNPVPTKHAAKLAELARQRDWERQAALRNALTCAFALQRLPTLDRDKMEKETAVLGRQSAVLRYRTWVLLQDNRIIQMHLGGLRARVARLGTLASRSDTQRQPYQRQP